MTKRNKTSKITKLYTRLRFCVTKSNKHIYAQIIDDVKNKTLYTCSTLEYKIRSQLKSTSTCYAAEIVGTTIATQLVKHGIYNVVFDKRNKPYHGKIKAVADAARKTGLNF